MEGLVIAVILKRETRPSSVLAQNHVPAGILVRLYSFHPTFAFLQVR
jgi:hypothetical protein